MAREKQTRKELLEEPDPITVNLHRIAGFFVTYHKQVIGGIAAFMLVVAAVSGYFYFQHRAENEAAILFAKAMDNYGTVIAQNGTPEEYMAVKQEFQYILDNYKNTEIVKIAYVQYAGASYRSGNYAQAVQAYQTALAHMPRDNKFIEMAQSGLAYSYDALGDYDNAIKQFEIIAADRNGVTRDQALFKLGELYAVTQNQEKSKAAYEEIVATHTGSIYFELAKNKISG
jgi:tetratricopeptide (TPR) repeat protein